MISRRLFLKAAAWFTAGGMGRRVFAADNRDRVLDLSHIHTGEHGVIAYRISGAYDTEALAALNRLLRCHFTDEVAQIEVAVLDLLCDVRDRFGREKEVQVLSGYRSPSYNAYLRSRGRGVAKDSLHLRGRAIDFSMPGVSPHELAEAARAFSAGGVGRYHDFIHIDVGAVRYW